MLLNQGYALIDRLCNKQEVCWECHQTLQAVKECIVMNECGHMIHETCFRSLQNSKNFCCKSCKGKIKIAFILNQIQVVQITSDGRNIINKRKKEFENKINEYFFGKIEMLDTLSEKLAEKELEIQHLNEKLRLVNADTQRDVHNFRIENNSSTNSNSFQNIPNPHFSDKSEILNTVKVKDKLKFYTDLAGLSPQQNIFSEEQQNRNEKNNKLIELDINQMNTRLYSQFQQKYNNGDEEDHQQKQSTMFVEMQKVNSQNTFIQKNDHHLKFSFGSKREINSESPERDMILSVEQPNNQNLEEMKTILYTQEQINQIKQLSNQNNQNSGLKKSQKSNEEYFNEDIFSFAKQTNSNCSASSQNSSLLRGRIRTSNSDNKNSLTNKKQSQINAYLFSYESPQKSQQNFLFNQENLKNVNSPINTKIQKCTSCSKERHSHPNSDSKLTIESSPDKRKTLTADFRLQSLSQARQRLNFFNLQPIQQNNSDKKNKNINQTNNQIQTNLIKNQIEENKAQSTNQLNYQNQQTLQKTNFDLDQTIIGNANDGAKSQLNSQSQSSQDSATQPNMQKITFNKNARRPHPDQNLIFQQNICLKMPKYVTKN
ncbi:hypothetical protein ABPG72_020508 [Tetrahymena utriculariae]